MSIADHAAFYGQNPGQLTCDVKPRLSKEQHDILEAHFRNQSKPNTNTKRGFAESLGVSLDKVNNWFQNRRAKSKQDAKKAADAVNLYPTPDRQQNGYSSDSDSSPAFASSDYFSMMQECSPEEQSNNGMDMSQMGQSQAHNSQAYDSNGYGNGLPLAKTDSYDESVDPDDLFDSPQEMNRRTLTQDTFDVWARQNNFQATNDTSMLSQMFPELQDDFKPQDNFAFPAQMGPLSSIDSTVPSTLSEQSVGFPSNNSWRHNANRSTSSSDWGGSRSSSVSAHFRNDSSPAQPPQIQQPQGAPPASSNKWQPGQSVPVDFNQLTQEFQQAAQARNLRGPAQYEPYLEHEQPLAWPSDEAYARRESSASMLTQSMSNVGIHPSQQAQGANVRTPVPPTSIATRRQRPRPAALGLASIRSHSYNGAQQTDSPGQPQPPTTLSPGQPLRRIKSHNVINGIASGRVQKSGTISAQQSPLAWTFNNAMNSPKALRHVSSQSSLAPPTPMSPREFSRSDQQRAFSSRISSGSGHQSSRQPSISESDLEQPLPEHGVPFAPSAATINQNFSSPPHTPHFRNQAQFQLPQRPNTNSVTENTPPQSAPASQQCFPGNTFVPASTQPLQQMQQPTANAPIPPQHQQHPQMQHYPYPQQQPTQFMQQMPHSVSMPNMNITASQPYMIPATSSVAYPPYANGMPVVTMDNNMQVMYPSQTMQHYPPQQPQQQQQQQQLHHHHHHQQQQQQQQQQPPPHHFTQLPPPPPPQFQPHPHHQHHPSSTTTTMPPPKPAQPELTVHEYSPPEDLKRAATPRKPGHLSSLSASAAASGSSSSGVMGWGGMMDNGGQPRSFVFANQGPEHFEKGAGGRSGKGGSGARVAGSGSASASGRCVGEGGSPN
ncbi:hypothetical protein MBLNU230_g7626t1 [Neophaeotheca triangularis]